MAPYRITGFYHSCPVAYTQREKITMDAYQKALIETLATVLLTRIRRGHWELAAGDIKFTAKALEELGHDS